MPSFSTFQSTSKPAILIIGPPGSGKTSAIAGIDGIYIIDVDNNIGAAFSYFQKRNLPCNAEYEIPHIKDNKLVERKDRFRVLNDVANKAVADPKTKALGIDGLSSLIEIFLDEVRRQQGRKIGDMEKGIPDEALQRQDWGLFGGLMRQWLIKLRACGKPLLVTGHVVVDTEELAETVKKLFINLPGKFANEISGLFTEVWYTSVEEQKDKEGKVSYKYFIRTRPDRSMVHLGLKSASQLDAKVEVNPAQLNKLLFS
jgi:hypothetical protein